MNYRNDEEFVDFIDYNDLGMPLAYAFANGIAEPKANGKDFVNETFDLLLAAMDLEDVGFESLDDLLLKGEEKE